MLSSGAQVLIVDSWKAHNDDDDDDDDNGDDDDDDDDDDVDAGEDDYDDDDQVGTPYWMAPEVILSGEIDHQEYDARADVWSNSRLWQMIDDDDIWGIFDIYLRYMTKIMTMTRSVGICILELADGRPPLSHLHPMRALMQV